MKWIVPAVVGGGLATTLILAVIISSLLSPSAMPIVKPMVKPVTLIAAGTSYTIPNYIAYEWIEFKVLIQAQLAGAFNATSRIEVFIMNTSQYGSFSAAPNGTIAKGERVNVSSLYNLSEVTSGSVQFDLSPGTYYLIFQNSPFAYRCGSNCSNSVKVLVTQDFVLRGP